MECEVAVVGGGIGGLTVAALLAQRGVDVCLLERDSQVGGCAASFEKFGYSFEQGDGLYTGWQPNEIHPRVFSELPVAPPEVRRLEPSYLVRLPDQSEISLTDDTEQFELNLRKTFPECADTAVSFYRDITESGATLKRAFQRAPDLLSSSKFRRARILLAEGKSGAQLLGARQQTMLERLDRTSLRFHRFIDVQLQALTQGSSEQVSYLQAALALSSPREGMFAIRGGAAALANVLAESIKRSGARLRLNSPVLRLAYDSRGAAVGLDLLSGERVTAARAIISNLTLWDTYGKLVGLNRTPNEIRKQLKDVASWGAYLLYLGMDEAAAASLVSDHVLTLNDWGTPEKYGPEDTQLMFAAAPAWNPRAPEDKRAVTVHAFTEVDEWFTFHRNETELEERDQQMLELCWKRLHAAMPELGNSVEVIDTATPRSFYELTRRKLGMVGGASPGSGTFWQTTPSRRTSLPNVFIVSDTTSLPANVAGVTQSALILADELTKR